MLQKWKKNLLQINNHAIMQYFEYVKKKNNMKNYDHFGEKSDTHRHCYKIHMSRETE